MVSISKIRQVALGLLYAALENGGTLDVPELFWELSLEKETDRYRLSLAKSICHVCRASGDSFRLLGEKWQSVSDALHGDLTALSLREEGERYQRQTEAMSAALAALRHCMKDKRRDTTEQLLLCCRDVMRLASVLRQLGDALLPPMADFPAYRGVLAPYAAAVRRCAKMLDACASLEQEESLEGKDEFAGLLRQARALKSIRPAAEKLAQAVLARRAELDALIRSLLVNYSMERLDVVDKCILYIALYELREAKLDVPIVVSEAIALADTYSGSKSAPFIHGIIAAAAKLG